MICRGLSSISKGHYIDDERHQFTTFQVADFAKCDEFAMIFIEKLHFFNINLFIVLILKVILQLEKILFVNYEKKFLVFHSRYVLQETKNNNWEPLSDFIKIRF